MDNRPGVVINNQDIYEGWADLAHGAGIGTIALHAFHQDGFVAGLYDLQSMMRGGRGAAMLHRMDELGLEREYMLHAAEYLLPRGLFCAHPEYFRMDAAGRRTPEGNLCLHSQNALDIMRERAVHLVRSLPSTTHRYYLWADDLAEWCRCDRCRAYSPGEQNLLLMNALLPAVQAADGKGRLACLAYMNTLRSVPAAVAPLPGVFLQWTGPGILTPRCTNSVRFHPDMMRAMNGYLRSFAGREAVVLDYWIDHSVYCRWNRTGERFRFDEDCAREDIAFYRAAGFTQLTSFACFFDEAYFRAHGEGPVRSFGALFAQAAKG